MDRQQVNSLVHRAQVHWNAPADEFNQWSELGMEEKTVLVSQEPCYQGDMRVFIKSGNFVRLIEKAGTAEWTVERVDGTTAGKRVICNERTLLWCMPGAEKELIHRFDEHLSLQRLAQTKS